MKQKTVKTKKTKQAAKKAATKKSAAKKAAPKKSVAKKAAANTGVPKRAKRNSGKGRTVPVSISLFEGERDAFVMLAEELGMTKSMTARELLRQYYKVRYRSLSSKVGAALKAQFVEE